MEYPFGTISARFWVDVRDMCKLTSVLAGILASIVLTSTTALADDCSEILKPELMDTSQLQRSSAGAEAARNWACSASLAELKNTSTSRDGSAGGGGLNILNWVGLTGNGSQSSSLTEEQLQRWKASHCSQSSRDMSRSAFEFYAQRALSPKAIDAWKACKLRQPALNCWASPKGDNQIEFHYVWNNNAVEIPTVKSFTAVRGASQPQQLRPVGEKIFIGDDSTNIWRDPRFDTLINISVVHQNRYVYSCVGFVPRVRPIEPPRVKISQLMGRWCVRNVRERPEPAAETSWALFGAATEDGRFYEVAHQSGPHTVSTVLLDDNDQPIIRPQRPEFLFRALSSNEFMMTESWKPRPYTWEKYIFTSTNEFQLEQYLYEDESGQIVRETKKPMLENFVTIWYHC
jgi:hypothetical protein